MSRIEAYSPRVGAILMAALLASTPALALAQPAADPNAATNADTTRLAAETARINAEAARLTAEAARDRARVDALGLPSFQGSTQLGQGVGTTEATMLASGAVRVTAARIVAAIPADTDAHRPIIVLAGDEALDFGRVGALRIEMAAIHQQFERVLALPPLAARRTRRGQASLSAQPTGQPMSSLVLGVPGVISAISAAAGLLRSDVEVTALDLQAISNRVLATTVSNGLNGRAVLLSSTVGAVDEDEGLWRDIHELLELRSQVQAKRSAIHPADPDKPSDAEKARLALYDAAMARFDTFYARVSTPDSNGALPIVQAQRLAMLWEKHPLLLRVYLDRAGGSMIRTTNILTTLALDDPIRITGGVIASFTLSDPSTGGVLVSDIVTCRTTASRMRTIQNGSWTPVGGTGPAVCSGGADPAPGRVTIASGRN